MAFKTDVKTTELAANCNTWYEHAVSNVLKSAFLLEEMFM